MVSAPVTLIRKVGAGVKAAVQARPRLFTAVALGLFAFDLALPPLVLSLTRKPVDFFTFNPWLSQLPEYLVQDPAPIGRKLGFLFRLALFWFSADSPYGGVEWGYAVDAGDLLRFAFTSLVVAAYFALVLYRRDQVRQCGWAGRTGRRGGTLGVLAGVLGLSTGPCGVMGCGAPVIPVMGLAFAGLSSGTLTLLAGLSRVGTALVLAALTLAVTYLGWRAGTDLGVPQVVGPPVPAGSA